MSLWYFAIVIIVCYSPLAWVRKLQYFAFGYVLGCSMIIFTVLVVTGYCTVGLIDEGPHNPDTFYAVNPETAKIWDMIGFSFYSFEGIGVVMPIFENTKSTVDFRATLIQAISSLTILFSGFGYICYRYFGQMDESKSFVIENLDQSSFFIKFTRLMFCINLVFSYPLTIYPTNRIVESFVFAKMTENTLKRKWLKNLSRTIVCFLACFLSITFTNVLDQFLGVSGALLGVPIILIMPTLCHYILVAKTKTEKVIDISFIVFSVFVTILCSYNGISAWVESSKKVKADN